MRLWLDKWLRVGVRLCSFVLMCLMWLCQPAATNAQEAADLARDASARELFEQGVDLAEHGDWPAAEDRYRRALALRNSPVIAYNLASALCELGKLIEASEMLRRVLADDKTESPLRQAATTLHATIAPRIGRIQIELQGQENDDSVLLDSRVLHSAQLNVEIPVDPGSHQLRLERRGKTLDLQTFTLEPGGRQEIKLVAPAVAATPLDIDTDLAESARPHARNDAPGAPAQKSGVLTRWWFWTGVVAVIGVGTLVGVAAASGGGQAQTAYQGSLGSVSVEVAQ
jgi:hypothetical protein